MNGFLDDGFPFFPECASAVLELIEGLFVEEIVFGLAFRGVGFLGEGVVRVDFQLIAELFAFLVIEEVVVDVLAEGNPNEAVVGGPEMVLRVFR
jgi:hypothetical protein